MIKDQSIEDIQQLLPSRSGALELLEASPVCTKIVDLDFNLKYMSSAGVKDLNIMDITEYYGQPYPFSFYPELFRTNMTDSMVKAKLHGKVINQEGVVNDLEGNELHYLSTLVPVKNDNCEVKSIMIVSTNITAQKKAEYALQQVLEDLETQVEVRTIELKESEERFSLAMRGANDGLWDWNLETGEVYYSPRWKSMLGYEESELVAKFDTWVGLIHPDDKGWVLEKVQDYLEGRTDLYEVEMRMQHKDGHEVVVLSRGFLVHNDSNDKPVRMVGTHVDITERKNSEQFILTTSDILKMIATREPASDIYDDIAQLYESRHPGLRCSMLLLEGNKLMHAGAPSLPKEYCDAVNGLENGPSVGSCGTSTYTGKRVLAENIETDPKWENIKHVALPHGMRCCWSEPIKNSSGEVLGAFGMYYNHPALPNEQESNDLESAARLAGIIMEREKSETELKRAEEALRESEEITRSIVNSSPLAIQLFDNEGYTLTVNLSHTKMFGSVPPADYSVLNDPLLQKAGLQNDIVRVSKGEIVHFPDMHYNRHDISPELPDNPIWSSGLGFPLFDSEGNVNNFVVMHQDITERKLAEEALQKSNKELFQARSYLEAVIDNANVWLSVIDREGNVVIWNKAAEQISGYSRDEVIGSNDIWEWSYPDLKYREEVCAKTSEFIERGEGIENFETTICNKNNESKVMSWHSRNLTDEDGEPIGSIAFGRDVTITKLLERRLRQAQKMEAIGTLAGGIAHDFNNILAAILGYAEMARDDSPPESTVARDLDKVLEGGNRAKDLVQQILAFSRQNEMEKIYLRPVSIVKEVIRMLRSSLPTTIEINQNITSATGLILADPTQIHQILMNLCTNALHAMEEAGGKLDISLKEVTLSTEDLVQEPNVEAGTFVQLSISDSGPGIPPDIKRKIFDPYFTTKETGKGTGMGLAIVHGIVKSYGGFISLYSEPGEGTAFHVFIPVIEKELPPEIEDVESISLGSDRILFIDDEEILAEMGKSMLERLGYHVTVRNTSIEALETFQNQPELFDLVITDQTMPGMTGSDIARRMIQIRPDIPIILCTGYSTIISEEKAKSMGIKEFALKPLSKRDLAVLIRKVLDKA